MTYQRGAGRQQLEQGGATQANAGVPSAQEPPDIAVEYANPEPIASADLRDSENSQLLSSPADPNFRPSPARGHGKVPRYILRNLPLLAVASKDPEAPVVLRAYYRALVARLEAEQGEVD